METRRLGNTDLDLSTIGLGTWAIGGDGWDYGWGPQDERDSIDAILEALELGINWIDTAPIYGVGTAETVVGKAIREWGKPVYIATKCGLIGDDKGRVQPRITKKSILEEVDNSLRRLDVDVIDLYQIHWPNPPKHVEEAWETLLELKEKEKIRWAGVSNFSAAQLEKISAIGPVSSLQPPYSLLTKEIERDALPWCLEHGTGVVAYSPMRCGLLTDKFSTAWVESLPESDWRKDKLNHTKEPLLSVVVEFVEALRSIAARGQKTTAQLAVRWVIEQQGITSAIVGARKRGQIAETVKAAEAALTEEEIKEVEEACAAYEDKVQNLF